MIGEHPNFDGSQISMIDTIAHAGSRLLDLKYLNLWWAEDKVVT